MRFIIVTVLRKFYETCWSGLSRVFQALGAIRDHEWSGRYPVRTMAECPVRTMMECLGVGPVRRAAERQRERIPGGRVWASDCLIGTTNYISFPRDCDGWPPVSSFGLLMCAGAVVQGAGSVFQVRGERQRQPRLSAVQPRPGGNMKIMIGSSKGQTRASKGGLKRVKCQYRMIT